jgi:hypothetical protein
MDRPSKGKQPVPYALHDPLQAISPYPTLGRQRFTGLEITKSLSELVMGVDPIPKATSPATPATVSIHKMRRSRQLSRDVIHTSERKPSPRASSAPARAMRSFLTIPKPLRRAISAKESPLGQSPSKGGRQSGVRSAPFPRVEICATTTSRSLISRRKSSRTSVGRLGLKPKHSVWRVQSPTTSTNVQWITEGLDDRKDSFSEKPRVRETLKHKKVKYLNTNIVDCGALDLPDTPGSMASTPKEMYGTPAEGTLFRPNPSHTELGKYRLLPGTTMGPMSPPLSPDLQRCELIARSNSALTIRITKPQSTAYRQQVYVPGPIQLEERISATPRKGSIATLEPFTGEAEGGRKRYSVAMDGIVAYFQSLGVLDEACEDGLDKYWERGGRASPTVRSLRKPTSAPPVPALPPFLAISSSYPTINSPARAVQQQEERQDLPSSVRQRFKLRKFITSAASML